MDDAFSEMKVYCGAIKWIIASISRSLNSLFYVKQRENVFLCSYFQLIEIQINHIVKNARNNRWQQSKDFADAILASVTIELNSSELRVEDEWLAIRQFVFRRKKMKTKKTQHIKNEDLIYLK